LGAGRRLELGGVLVDEDRLDPVVEVSHVKDATVLPPLPPLVLQAVVVARNLRHPTAIIVLISVSDPY